MLFRSAFVTVNGQFTKSPPQCIAIPPRDQNSSVSIMAPHGEDYRLKIAMLSAPLVAEKEIKLYSYEANVINVWNVGRTDNGHGSVTIPQGNSFRFCDLQFRGLSGTVYLMCPSYSEIDQLSFTENKKAFLLQDLNLMWKNMVENPEIKELTLVVSKQRMDLFSSLVNMGEYFANIITISDDSRRSHALVEHICGLNIGGSLPSFVSFLEFGESNKVVDFHLTKAENCNLTTRTRGRVQISGTGTIVKFSIVLALKFEDSAPQTLKIDDVEYPIVYRENDFSPSKLDTIAEVAQFYDQIFEHNTEAAKLKFLLESPLTLKYTFTNPLAEFDSADVQDDENVSTIIFIYEMCQNISSVIESVRTHGLVNLKPHVIKRDRSFQLQGLNQYREVSRLAPRQFTRDTKVKFDNTEEN